MASKIRAIKAYCPRIELGKTAQLDELVGYLADRTGLNEGEIRMVMTELRDAVVFFNRTGRGVKLEGLGIYAPKIDLEGNFGVSHRLDKRIENELNAPGAFGGEIINRENIGKTSDDLVALWNEDNPDDPVT
jgi:hypothetical protein